MSEILTQEVKKLKLENPTKRQEYLDLIDRLLETAFKKAQSKYCKNTERVAWIRAITGLINAGADVLRDSDLESILKRLEVLEKAAGGEK